MSRYFVCITVSRRQISFEYHQEGANKSLAPFPGDELWPVPLSLYCTPSKIEIGHAAERAAARGVEGAFREWFQYLSSDQKVNYLGQPQPVNHLLLLAAEEQFRRFLRDVRYNVDGGLENCRATMPLVLSFEDDVDDSMRIFLVNLFKNVGYGRVHEEFHNRLIALHYGSSCKSDHLVIVDSDGVDLTLSVYVRGREDAKFKRVILKAGEDPRLQSICNMIWDKTGAEYSFLNREMEQPRLELMASEVINANQVEFEGMMSYSNGERLGFLITRSELMSSGPGRGSMAEEIAGILDKEVGLRPEDVTVVLRNFAVKSDYFLQTLGSRFPSLLLDEEAGIEVANSILVRNVMKWMGDNEAPTLPASTDIIVKDPPPGNGSKEEDPSGPDPIPSDPQKLNRLKRDMRAPRANIKAKFENGDIAGAKKIYQQLISRWDDTVASQLLSELFEWLGERGITRETLLNASEPPKPLRPERSEPKRPTEAKQGLSVKSTVKGSKNETVRDMAEGEQLLKKGLFSEAKRFFAGIGDERMKQLCIDLLRDSRDLKAMASQNASSLSPTARKNNLEKLKRILISYRKAGLSTEQVEDLIRKLK